MKKNNLFGTGWLAVSLALASTTPVMAQVVRVGGGLQRGFARPPLLVNLHPAQVHSMVSGPYSPAQIRHAYGVDQFAVTGSGQTIGIVDAYGDPSIQKDLNNFCAYFKIPSTTVTIIYPQGKPRG